MLKLHRDLRRAGARLFLTGLLALGLGACGGGEEPPKGAAGNPPTSPSTASAASAPTTQVSSSSASFPAKATSTLDAHRLAQQASFGPTESLVAAITVAGPRKWLHDQMTLVATQRSRYAQGGNAAIHQVKTQGGSYCRSDDAVCWAENYSSTPLTRDFYVNAVNGQDQLRQRVAYALQQWLVVSGAEIESTYGLRAWHNMLLDQAFGNYRDLLRKIILSPVMGDYLNNANNDHRAPNENFARELLQLFSIGLCDLASDGSLPGDRCTPTYGNSEVRDYAFALTGWTYPSGGTTYWGCPRGRQCRFHDGDMQAVPEFHDTAARPLLSGVRLAAGHSPQQALEAVLDSLMEHPNVAPFVARHLIQNLVMSNPAPAYVGRVAAAFRAGSYAGFGTGRKGDLAATVAAVLLDGEARRASVKSTDGSLRPPVLMFTAVTRALRGQTDGESLGWWWGQKLHQHVLRSPTVFNDFAPDYRVPGLAIDLVGPAFGIHNTSAALDRMQFLNCMVYWNPCGTGTEVRLDPWFDGYLADGAPDAGAVTASPADGKLVDRLSLLAYGHTLPADERALIVQAMAVPWVPPQARVKTAIYLVFASPRFHVLH